MSATKIADLGFMSTDNELSNLCLDQTFGLRPPKTWKYRTELDRFGFTSFLYNLLNPPFRFRGFCNWLHGWEPYWRSVKFEWLGGAASANNYHRSLPSVVYNKHLRDLFIKNSYQDVRLGPLPFAFYHQNQLLENNLCRSDSRPIDYLIVLPKLFGPKVEHLPLDNTFFSSDVITFVDEALESVPYGSNIVFLLYYRDIEIRALRNLICDRKIKWVNGVNPYDIYGLERIHTLFSLSKTVYGQETGSFLPYAALCGAKVGLSKNSYLTMKPWHQHIEKHKWRSYDTYQFVENHYPHLLVNNILDATVCSDWAKRELGYHYSFTNDELIKILGWNSNQIYYNQFRSLMQRATNKIKK